MRAIISGGTSGIGLALTEQLERTGWDVYSFGDDGREPGDGIVPTEADAVVACAGTNFGGAIYVNLERTIEMFKFIHARVYVAMSGGGVGGRPSLDLPGEYIASKAGIVAYVEWCSLKNLDRQYFAVAPGLTDTKANIREERGAKPEVPAAFIAELLTGKYRHLSGSLLAAQRDVLARAHNMRLRREPVDAPVPDVLGAHESLISAIDYAKERLGDAAVALSSARQAYDAKLAHHSSYHGGGK